MCIVDSATADACRVHMVGFMKKCHQVTERIMSCFAVGLGLPEAFFKEVRLPLHPVTGNAVVLALDLIASGKCDEVLAQCGMIT